MKDFFNLLMQGNIGEAIKRYADIVLALLVVMVVGLLIVPMPTWIIDLLICANISIALVMLLISLYISNVLSLSSFPTILLVATLFRLGLNVATARLILLNADAGEVITAFGEFSVRGNFVVGIVIFLLLMLVNMLVIAKGSERVAEVAARFTLDAMPGKQMSIDADLRNGTIDLDEARKKRKNLERESQLFGAMDGAMKFVKGDVIAGLIIFAINIIAGIIIGVTQKEMTAEEAIHTYTILSIGDGLVSVIPALIMSVCSGMIVTRVSSEVEESNLGQDVAIQMLNQPKAFAISGVFIAAIAMVPGLPTAPFMVIAVLIGGISFGLYQNDKHSGEQSSGTGSNLLKARDKKMAQQKRVAVDKAKAQEGQSSKMMPVVTPITLEVATDLIPLVDDTSNFLGELIPMMRDGLFYELGVRFPGVRVRGNNGSMPAGNYSIMLNEVPTTTGHVDQTKCLVNDTPDRLRLLGIEATRAENPANGVACAWIPLEKQEIANQAGLTTWDPASFMILHLSAVLRRNSQEFLGIQEVQNMLDQLEQAFPTLVKEVVPKSVSMFQLTEIARRLVEEEISVRDMRGILQALAEWAPVEHDNVMLTEYVRSSLKRYISHKYAGGNPTLVVYLLDPQIEDTVRSSIQHTSSGSYLALEPEITQEILQAVRSEVGSLPPSAQNPVILTTQEIRRYFRKLCELEFPHLAVLSYQELSPDLNIQPISRIMLSQGS